MFVVTENHLLDNEMVKDWPPALTAAMYMENIPDHLVNLCMRHAIFGVQDLLDSYHWSQVPYHNKEHCCLVAWLAMSLWIKDNLDSAASPGAAREALSVILYAALFHDARHTGGTVQARFSGNPAVPDTVNVALARMAWANFCCHVPVQTEIAGKIDRMIACTVYPFNRDPDCSEGEYLRDADALVFTHPARRLMLPALSEEMGTRLSWVDHLQFVSGVSIFTPAGKSLHAAYLEQLALRVDSGLRY